MRNPQAAHIDFTPFMGMIPDNQKFLPSNLDMVMERKGKFLVAEWKRKGETIKPGQMRLLRALADAHGFTVLLITGDTDDGLNVQKVERVLPDGTLKEIEGDLIERLRGWYEWADKS